MIFYQLWPTYTFLWANIKQNSVRYPILFTAFYYRFSTCNKVGFLNLGDYSMRFELENFSVYCDVLTHGPTLPISTIRAVYALLNLITLCSSFKLFVRLTSFRGTILLRSSIVSAFCPADYTTTSVSLWTFFSNRTVSTHVSLPYVFNFACSQINANLRFVCRLLSQWPV